MSRHTTTYALAFAVGDDYRAVMGIVFNPCAATRNARRATWKALRAAWKDHDTHMLKQIMAAAPDSRYRLRRNRAEVRRRMINIQKVNNAAIEERTAQGVA